MWPPQLSPKICLQAINHVRSCDIMWHHVNPWLWISFVESCVYLSGFLVLHHPKIFSSHFSCYVVWQQQQQLFSRTENCDWCVKVFSCCNIDIAQGPTQLSTPKKADHWLKVVGPLYSKHCVTLCDYRVTAGVPQYQLPCCVPTKLVWRCLSPEG